MSQLSQIVALVKGTKTRTQTAVTSLYHKIQKADLFAGLVRHYRPKNEDGEALPSEEKLVQVRVDSMLAEATESFVRLWDLVATQEYSNCTATADIVIGQDTVATAVPVSYLMFLEKQFVDLRTFLEKLPILDPAEQWQKDEGNGVYVTPVITSVRTKKVPQRFVKYDATKEHPAQVEVYYEDQPVGYWDTRKLSGALPVTARDAMLGRVSRLIDAVKVAREKANRAEAEDVHIAKALLDYVIQQN